MWLYFIVTDWDSAQPKLKLAKRKEVLAFSSYADKKTPNLHMYQGYKIILSAFLKLIN